MHFKHNRRFDRRMPTEFCTSFVQRNNFDENNIETQDTRVTLETNVIQSFEMEVLISLNEENAA